MKFKIQSKSDFDFRTQKEKEVNQRNDYDFTIKNFIISNKNLNIIGTVVEKVMFILGIEEIFLRQQEYKLQ